MQSELVLERTSWVLPVPRVDLPRECIELLETRRALAPAAGIHERRAGRILPRRIDRAGNQAHRIDHHAVADREVAEDARGATDQAVAPDHRAAGDGGASRHRGMRTDAHVVADLDLIVEAHVFL